jgi:MoxR-like ATPase
MSESSGAILARVKVALGGVIRGKPEAIDLVLVGILSSGHVLLEDVPGVGKTTLAKALGRVFSVAVTRVQFTPDLLPTDILGCQVLRPAEGSFHFQPGPVFTNILLADEINRASPRTQSALLEAMSEGQVTVDGTTHKLPAPFFVIATQNPVDSQGTYPLPEAQLDRFLLRLAIGYPPEEDELGILFAQKRSHPLDAIGTVATSAELLALQAGVREVEVKEPVARYLLRLVTATRKHPDLELGASPRGTLGYFRAAQAQAFLCGRAYVTPQDIQALAVPVLAHRLVLTPQSRYGGTTTRDVVAGIVTAVDVPT